MPSTLRAFRAILTAAVWLAVAGTASATGAPQNPLQLEEPTMSVTYVEKGARVPFGGYLLAGDRLIEWRRKIEQLQYQIRADQAFQAKVEAVHQEFCARQINIEVELSVTKIGLHQRRIEELAGDLAAERNVGFLKRPSTWFATGLIVGVLAVVIPAVAL